MPSPATIEAVLVQGRWQLAHDDNPDNDGDDLALILAHDVVAVTPPFTATVTSALVLVLGAHLTLEVSPARRLAATPRGG